MNQHNTNKITDVIIHTDEQLDDQQFASLSEQVYRQQGIVSLSRNPHAPRFLMVVYNAANVKARSILETVRSTGFNAKLVGI